MFYSFECDECGHADDYSFGMNDDKKVDCVCGVAMRRVFSIPGLTGDLPTIGSWNYLDPSLGEINGKADRTEKMKRAGLKEWHEPECTVKYTQERKKIRETTDLSRDKGAAHEHNALGREKSEARTREVAKSNKKEISKHVEGAIRKAVQQTGMDVS